MKTLKFTIFLWFMLMGSLFSKDQIEISYSPHEAAFKQAKGTYIWYSRIITSNSIRKRPVSMNIITI